MNYLIFSVCLFTFLQTCTPGDETVSNAYEVSARVDQLQNRYAPDRRTDRVAVDLRHGSGSPDTLEGYTTVPAAAASLDSLASQLGLVAAVRLLPDAALTEGYALVRTSVANIRTEAGHSQELTSQALMGTPLQLLDEQDGWYLVRTPDRYIAWLEVGAVTPVTAEELAGWFAGDLRTCGPAPLSVREAREARDGGRIISELVSGNIVSITEQSGEHTHVELPDGRSGWVVTKGLTNYTKLTEPKLAPEALLETAYTLSGKPYLWGGTSTQAMDCSGFTKMAYYLNGYVIPRDASQQVNAGVDVPLDDDFSQLRRGDLLFFGAYREDGSERTTHVGFYVGDGRFLHAGADNDYITENSLLEGDADYAAHRKESLLRARRLSADGPGVVGRDSAFAQLYTKSSSR